MEFTDAARASYGLEIEQDRNDVTSSYRRRSRWSWHRDGSGPIETDIGPYKVPKFLLNEFYRGTRDDGFTWEWTAASSTAGTANGHGSHLHIRLEQADNAPREEAVKAWAIAYNTVVELVPVFAPFFCHDWERGFRHGTDYPRSHELNVRKWADTQSTRKSPESIADQVMSDYASRSYNAVTLNGGRDKPVTIELRLNDAFPGMALAAASIIKKIVVTCVERGWSPKRTEDSISLDTMYRAIYESASSNGLMTAMRACDAPEYQEGRGIPRVEGKDFDSLFDLLREILESRHPKPGKFKRRAVELVKTGDDSNSPHRNGPGLWAMDADRGDFMWTTAPDLPTE